MPIGYEVVQKDLLYSDLKTRRQKRKASVSKNVLFRQLVQQAIDNQVLFEYVLADNWFGAKDNMLFIHQAKKHFIFAIKSNRLVAKTKQQAKHGQFPSLIHSV